MNDRASDWFIAVVMVSLVLYALVRMGDTHGTAAIRRLR